MPHKTCKMREIEKERGKPIEQILEELCEKHALLEDAAAELGIEQSTLYIWLTRFGFERRWMKPAAEPVGKA